MPKVRNKLSKLPSVPYARGFKPPTLKQSERALGILTKSNSNTSNSNSDICSRYFSTVGFKQIPRPTSINDWLAQYNEPGQSYSEFISQCPWLTKRKLHGIKQEFYSDGHCITEKYPNGKIYLIPIGDFINDINTPNFDDITDFTQKFFSCPTQLLPGLNLEMSGKSKIFLKGQNKNGTGEFKIELASRIDNDNGHYQLKVSNILTQLRNILPDDALCLVAFTLSDLYDTKPDLFVAGMTAGNHRVAVFSFCRYSPVIRFSDETWSNINEVSDISLSTAEIRKIMLQRSCRILVHEISHIFGLDHCIWYDCLMNGSGHLHEDFTQSMFLCPIDLRKLYYLFGFDVVKRYNTLLEFYKKHGLNEESVWITERLKLIMT